MSTLLVALTAFSIFGIASAAMAEPASPAAAPTFTNPVLDTGADPHAVYHDGEYFYIASDTARLTLYRTPDITALRSAKHQVIWTPPPGTDHSRNVWAPEIHHIDGKWYVYYAADDGNSDNHHLYVLENASADPFADEFTMKARLKTDPNDNWGIDASVFHYKGSLYMVWSGWATRRVDAETACIWIARMANPWTVDSPRTMLSQPEFAWERVWRNPPEWGPPMGHEIYVNEGPASLVHDGRVFITYSASGCWTPSYCLGLLTLKPDATDPLDPAAWTKSNQPVFVQQPADHIFGPGHNSFFTSPDGTVWNFYHANDNPRECGGPKRSPRIQRVDWAADGTPMFGTPVSTETTLAKPAVGR